MRNGTHGSRVYGTHGSYVATSKYVTMIYMKKQLEFTNNIVVIGVFSCHVVNILR